MVRFRSPAPFFIYGELPERPKGTDCKSVVHDFDGSNPSLPTKKSCLQIANGVFVLFGLFKQCNLNSATFDFPVLCQQVLTLFYKVVCIFFYLAFKNKFTVAILAIFAFCNCFYSVKYLFFVQFRFFSGNLAVYLLQ